MTAAFTGDHDAGIRVLGDTRPRRGVPARLLRLASDERLVELVRGGSEAAFEAMFDRHHRGVLGFCRHMLGSVEEAEDAVQHTFLAAYRELADTDKPLQLRPWLYTIARNRCLTVLRTRRHQAGGEVEDPPTEHLAAAVERRHDLRELLRDVASLPDDQRGALVLSELGDMSHDEIAAVLGCRREKVKALVFQARSSLIASRTARDTSCAEIREQLANLRGGALRRTELRRHVRECAGCRDFRDQVRAQRRDLGLVLPVAPTVGLKTAVIGATGAGVAAGTGGVLSTGVAAKVIVAAVIAGGSTVAVEKVAEPDAPRPAQAPRTPAASSRTAAHLEVAVPAVARREEKAGQPARDAAPGRVGRPDRHGRTHAKPPTAANPPKHGKPAEPPGQAKSGKPGEPPGQAKAEKPAQPPEQATAGKPAQPPGEAKAGTSAKALTPAAARAKAPGAPYAGARAKGVKPPKPPTAAEPVKGLKPPKPPPAAEPVKPVRPPTAAQPLTVDTPRQSTTAP